LKKTDLIEIVDELPDEVDLRQLVYRLYVLQRLELAEADIAAGDLIPNDEVNRLMEEWLA
jgi:hypothetical protein